MLLRRATYGLWLVVLVAAVWVEADPETVHGLLDKRDSPPQFDGQTPFQPQVGHQRQVLPNLQQIGKIRPQQHPETFSNGLKPNPSFGSFLQHHQHLHQQALDPRVGVTNHPIFIKPTYLKDATLFLKPLPSPVPKIPNLPPYAIHPQPIPSKALEIPFMPPQNLMSEQPKQNNLDQILQPKASLAPEGANRLSYYSMMKIDDKKWYPNDQNSNILKYSAHQKETIPFIPPQKTFSESLAKDPIPSTMKPQVKYTLPTTRKLPALELKALETTTSTLEQGSDPNEGSPGEPVVAMLKQDGDRLNKAVRSGFDNEGEGSGPGAASLVIGFTFVAAFVSSAVGLLVYNVWNNLKAKKQPKVEFYAKSRPVRSPNDEDQTPPELRGFGHPSFVQPDLSPNGRHVTSPVQNGSSNGSNSKAGFLNGKLIFHDPPGNYLRSNGTHHLPQSALGAIPKQKMLLPTRAAVTDDLITPKYEEDLTHDESTDDGEDDDDESDDTVYECPGLASSSGGMVIKNPFFLQSTKESSGLPPPMEAIKAQIPMQPMKETSPTGNNNSRAVENLNSSMKMFH